MKGDNEKMETKKKVKSCYSLPAELVKQLEAQSLKRNLNKSVLIQLALEEYFKRKEEQGVRA